MTFVRGYLPVVLPDDAVDVLREARALGVELPDPARTVACSGSGDPAALRPVLDEAWDAVVGAVRAAVGDPEVPARLVGVLDRLGALREAVHRQDVARRDRRLRGVRDALAELRHADGVTALERDAAAALTHLGFDRGIVSRLEGGVWVPHQVMVERDPVWAADILGAGRADPRPFTHELPEAALLRRGGSILVDRVQDRDDVYTAIARSSRSLVYAASRIPGEDRTLGFLHGDRYYSGGAPVTADRVALEAFGEGLGHAVVRLHTLERTRAVADRVRALSSSLPGAAGDVVDRPGPRAPVADDARDAVPAPPVARALDRLTPREQEVLTCVASGGTNYSIARRLGVSEGTVKTHVKNILHKLEVANRAQAVARWWDPGGP